ncbi:MAG: hypothetical protein R3A79_03035 [Nannocystaceae bacterium]
MRLLRRQPRAHGSLGRRFSRALLVAALLDAGCSCGDAPPSATPAEIAAAVQPPPQPAAPAPAAPKLPGERLRIHDPGDLAAYASGLVAVRDLDLALSGVDRVDLAVAEEGADPCRDLDLRDLARRLPNLERLRISGCQAAVHAGLDAFAELRDLELVDLVLDGVTMGRLLALPKLQALRLTRVTPGSESTTLLRGLGIDRLALRELAGDSPLIALVGLLPKLRAVELHGAWAGHKAMIQLAKAERLRALTLRDTDVSNFSLNQIKGLSRLREVELRGSAFNDKTPLYFRELPVRSFTCACPNLGEAGLRALRHLSELRRLELLSSRLGPGALEGLADLEALEALIFYGDELGAAGFAALAALKGLRELHLEIDVDDLRDPRLTGLGELAGLRRLTLHSPLLDDRITPQLRQLHALEELDLSGTAISDATLDALREMPELRRLRLHHTRVTNRGLANLSGLHKLEVLELDHTDVVDAGVAHLAGLRALRELRLDSTLVTDQSLETVAGLEGLERLNLADTVVTTAGVEKLGKLERLQSVNLAGTRARR